MSDDRCEICGLPHDANYDCENLAGRSSVAPENGPASQAPLWTAIARCRVCKKELNRAVHVPENERGRVTISAPMVAICDVRSHNTMSDLNLGAELEWIPETPNDQALAPL